MENVAAICQERRNIADLKPAEYNPRKSLQPGDPEYESLKRSIETFGYVDPIIVNKDGTVIGGHQRLSVLVDLGYTEADVAVVDLSKHDEKALNIALNKISGEWDEDSYELHRGVRRYEVVRKNIQEYSKWKREYSPDTSLGIQCVAKSVENVEKFYAANADLDVDYIVFRPLESTGGCAYSKESDKARVAEIIQAVNNLAQKDSRVVLNFKWHLLGVQEKSCVAAWAQIALNERGEVMYCCHKPYQVVGHILDEDILAKKAAAVTDMRTCDIPCRLTAPNAFVASTMIERKDACFL